MRHEPKLEPCQAIALAWQTRGSLDGLSHVFFIVMTCAHVFFIAMGVCIGSLLVLKKSRFNGKGSAL
jgi:hypothetical protein